MPAKSKLNIINFDDLIDDKFKLKFRNNNPLSVQHPAHCLLIGGTGRGKSNLLLNLLFNKDCMMTYDRIYMIVRDVTEDKNQYLLQHFNDIKAKIKKKTGRDIDVFTLSDDLADIPDLNSPEHKGRQNLLILDDLISIEAKNQKQVVDYYIRSRKQNFSCLYLTQSFFAVPKTIRQNTTYFFLFEIPSRRELVNLYQDIAGVDVDTQQHFNQMIRKSTGNHKFFMVDTKTIIPIMKYRCGFDLGWLLPSHDRDDDTISKPMIVEIIED